MILIAAGLVKTQSNKTEGNHYANRNKHYKTCIWNYYR